MIKYAILLGGVLVAQQINAQTSIHSTGHEATGSGGSASISIGQPFITIKTTSTDGYTADEGGLHPYEIHLYLSTEPVSFQVELEIKTYPNPVQDLLNLDVVSGLPEDLIYQLTDATGKIISANPVEHAQTSIPMHEQTSGIYYLTVRSKSDQSYNTYKIVKN